MRGAVLGVNEQADSRTGVRPIRHTVIASRNSVPAVSSDAVPDSRDGAILNVAAVRGGGAGVLRRLAGASGMPVPE